MFSVLVVDDEALIRKSIVSKLSRLEESRIGPVRESDSGESALALCTSYAPDIVITDIKMGPVNGIQLILKLSQRLPQSRFLVISGYHDYDLIRDAFRNGAVDYLLKPLVFDQFEKSMRQICDLLQAEQQAQPGGIMVQIVSYMQENYHKQLTLAQMSEYFSISYAHLSALISKNLNLPFSEYLTQLRMQQAVHLLSSSTRNIQEISAMVGYDSIYTFSRAFKRHFGVAPSYYRKQADKKKPR